MVIEGTGMQRDFYSVDGMIGKSAKMISKDMGRLPEIKEVVAEAQKQLGRNRGSKITINEGE